MALVAMSQLLEHAKANGYAVGYFEAWNLESLLAVKDAAEEARSPVIIGFNGGFLENPERPVPENIRHYGRLGRAVAENSPMPLALILNEAKALSTLLAGLEAGFNVVMHDGSGCGYQQSVSVNRELVAAAHELGAEVEAEFGELPEAAPATASVAGGQLTDPELASRFVEQTGVDALAVSVGNVHVLEAGKVDLDLDLLGTLLGRLPVPLVLHGGTGINPDSLQRAVAMGVAKINVGTIMRRSFVDSLGDFLRTHRTDQFDPGALTSTGGRQDMLYRARTAVKEQVLELMRIFGSDGQAGSFSSINP
jgi:fructose-bisphosphate aldolase class II